jgi:hypothetical protein
MVLNALAMQYSPADLELFSAVEGFSSVKKFLSTKERLISASALSLMIVLAHAVFESYQLDGTAPQDGYDPKSRDVTSGLQVS